MLSCLRGVRRNRSAPAARPLRKPCSCFSAGIASLPGCPPPPKALLARRPRFRHALPCWVLPLACRLRGCLAPRHAPRFPQASLRPCSVRRCGLHGCAAMRCPKMRAPRAQVANGFCDSPRAAPCCPAVLRRPTLFNAVASSVVGCCCARRCPLRVVGDLAALHATLHDSRESRSGLAACNDAALTVAPRRNVPRCARRAPNSQNVFVLLCRRRLVARLPTASQRLARLSPAASWSVAVRDVAPCVPVVIPPRAMRHCTLHARLAPALRRKTMRLARLRRVATSQVARTSCPRRKTLFCDCPSAAPCCPAVCRGPTLFIALCQLRRGVPLRATLPLARRL